MPLAAKRRRRLAYVAAVVHLAARGRELGALVRLVWRDVRGRQQGVRLP